MRGEKFQGSLIMTGDVTSEYSVNGEILDDGSLENVAVDKVLDESYQMALPEFFGTIARGRWVLKDPFDGWTCDGTYVAQRMKSND